MVYRWNWLMGPIYKESLYLIYHIRMAVRIYGVNIYHKRGLRRVADLSERVKSLKVRRKNFLRTASTRWISPLPSKVSDWSSELEVGVAGAPFMAPYGIDLHKKKKERKNNALLKWGRGKAFPNLA